MKAKAVFGLIGTGGISQTQHLPNLSRAAHVRLKTVCDLDSGRLYEQQRAFEVPHATTDYRTVLADPEIDAVVIATSPSNHARLALDAINAGKHVYVEKPLAPTVEECRPVVEAWRASDSMVVVGLNRRMAPSTEQAIRILAAHGGPFNIHYRIADAYWEWGMDNPPGQRVLHELCHIFDLLRYLTHSEATSVYCVESRPDDEAILLKFDSGCVATIMSTGNVEYDMPKESLEVIVDRGGFIVTDFVELRTFGLDDFEPVYRFPGHVRPGRDDFHAQLFAAYGADAMTILRRLRRHQAARLSEMKRRNPAPPAQQALERYIDEYAANVNYMMDKGWLHAMEHFAVSILKGRLARLATPEDGLRAAVITEACIRSRSLGQAVPLESPEGSCILEGAPA